jgi:two-component system nitrogen regulation response regulator GlnG
LGELTDLVQRAVELPQHARTQKVEIGDEDGLPLVGGSPAMQEIYRAVARLTQNDLSVLITGESGTGKELVARALHDFGTRKRGQFVALNMAAIPRELIESELFGHEKGAFTGASQRMEGRFAQAEGGTLFLDEIGDMPMETQTRLLRVLQEGEYTTIGGRRPIKTDVRIIAATHQDLRRLIRQGLFREDLYFRLNVVPLRLPPLRERVEDIADLVRHFVGRGGEEGLAVKSFDNDALDVMRGHNWPGNVRELENLVRRLLALTVEDMVGAEAVRMELQESNMEGGAATREETGSLTESLNFHLTNYFKSHGDSLPPNGLYDRVLREVETPLIELSLEATRGNQIKAAELLGLNRNTLRKKIQELNIEVVRAPKK